MSTTNVLTLEHLEKFNKALRWISHPKEGFGKKAPLVAIITGSSGPRELKRYFDKGTYIEQELSQDLFTLPKSEGHLPHICKGKIKGVPVVWVPGRTHFNEHGDVHDTVMMARLLAMWGCRKFIITNLSGALYVSRHPIGSVCVLSDHIPLEGCSPLMGNIEILKEMSGSSVRHIGMVETYSKKIEEKILDLEEASLNLATIKRKRSPYPYPLIRFDVVYKMNSGPQFETVAQKQEAIRIGVAHLFGMSTVPEVETLAQMKTKMPDIEICALSMVSNEVAAASLSHEQNLKAIKKESPKFARLIADLVPKLVAQNA